MDEHAQQQATGIDGDVAFAAFAAPDLLGRVAAARPPFCRLDALGVDDRC